jgi:hypothetical protein
MQGRPILRVTMAMILTIAVVTPAILLQTAQAAINRVGGDIIASRTKGPGAAPIAISGNNVYVAWPSNKTGNSEIMFRVSTDDGKTFGSKIDLSNSKGVVSNDASIAAAGNNVYVSWWERANQTSNEPVMRVSNDNGKSFGEKIMLSNNETTAKPLM